MKKFKILFTAILGLLLLSCEQKDIYFSHEGGEQGLEVTAKFEANNPLPEGLDGDIYSFSFVGQEQLFNAYHGVNPYNPPFILPMDAGTYDMLFMTSDMNNMENLALNWGGEEKRAEPAYFEFTNVEQESAQGGYEYLNSPFKDKEWYQATMFVEHATSFPTHTAQPPVWMASYEEDVVIEQATQEGVSPTIPTGNEGDDKITKLTTYPQQMVFQPTFTVEISGLTDVDAVYMSVAALEGGAPLIPGYGHNGEPITYEAQMELTDNGDGTYTAVKQFNTFGLDERASQFGQTLGVGNVCIVVENSAAGAAATYTPYDFDVTRDETKFGKTMTINDELGYNVTSINIVEENLQFTLDPTQVQEQTLTLEYNPTNATNKGVTWSSNNENAVEVDQNGKITVKGVGVAKITATLDADNTITDFCDVTVNEQVFAPERLILEPGTMVFTEGELVAQELLTIFEPANTTNKAVTWSYSMDGVVTVTEKNTTTFDVNITQAARAGDVITITAISVADPTLSAECEITVEALAILVTDINFDNLGNGLHFSNIGETKDLSREVSVLPANATNKTLSWSVVSGADVVSVNQTTGMAEALKAGAAIVRASATDGSGVTQDLNVKVWKPTYTITFDANGGAPTGSTWTTDEDGTLVSSWLSIPTPALQGSDFAGWFTAPQGGTEVTDATVFTQDATVYAQWRAQGTLVTDINFSLTSGTIELTLLAGSVITFDLGVVTTVDPNNATDKSLTWSEGNPAIATVDANGVITAVGVGSTTVTATANDGSGVSESVTVNVSDPAAPPVTVSSVEITTDSGSDFTLKMGEDKTLAATVSMSDGTSTSSVTWSSNNTNIATVVNGKVVAKAVGSAVITATSTADATKKDTLTVTVTTTGVVIPPIN